MLGAKKFRYTVLATVSAAALMVSIGRGALAADLAPVASDRWWLSVEGQYLLYDGDPADYGIEGKSGDTFSLQPDDGWGIGGEVGFRPADSLWSFVGRVRYGESNKDEDDSSFGIPGISFNSAKADHREHHIVADLEIGRDVGLGALGDDSNLRLFAGLRFAHLKADGSYSNYSIDLLERLNSSDVDIDRTFTGIGPRIGFDATVPVSEQFSLDLGAAGAVLFGRQKFEASGYSAFYIPIVPIGGSNDIDETRSKSVVVPNVEASAALSWHVTDNAKFTLGYRVDSYFDVFDDGLVEGDRDEGDRIMHGPFVKVTIGSGGDGG